MITCTHQVPLGNTLFIHNLWDDALTSKIMYWDVSGGEQLSGFLAHVSICQSSSRCVQSAGCVAVLSRLKKNGSTPVAALELCWQKPLPGWRSHGFNLAILFQGRGFFFQDTAILFQCLFVEDGVAIWNEPVPRQLTRRDVYCSLQVACHHFLPQWVFYYGFTKWGKKGSLVFFQILDEDTNTYVHLKKRIWDEMNSLPSLPNI